MIPLFFVEGSLPFFFGFGDVLFVFHSPFFFPTPSSSSTSPFLPPDTHTCVISADLVDPRVFSGYFLFSFLCMHFLGLCLFFCPPPFFDFFPWGFFFLVCACFSSFSLVLSPPKNLCTQMCVCVGGLCVGVRVLGLGFRV